MIQAQPKPVTFEEFIAWYPENSGHHYELHRGVIVEMSKPRGKHSEIAGFLAYQLNIAIGDRNAFIPKECLVKPRRGESGYEPDVIVCDRAALENEPYWETASAITRRNSASLIVEVVSTNWRDDYLLKAGEYEEMGILEYWIVDYLGLGGRRFIGNPKQPIISIYKLVNGEYQIEKFRGNDSIASSIFPELNLTPERIFAAR